MKQINYKRLIINFSINDPIIDIPVHVTVKIRKIPILIYRKLALLEIHFR